MNILIPHSWLSQYLKTNATPNDIAKCLSLCGPSAESLTKKGNDYIYDFEVTTNRVDMMSVYGIAREAATILPQFGFKATLKPLSLAIVTSPDKPLPLTIKDPQHTCRRILGIVLDNVNLKPSNQLIKNRLNKVGIRSLNNVIDITNYVMTEVGHPTHVFDYDRIKTHQLILRKSKKGEKLTSLENKTYTLPDGYNVIDDSTGRIIDLPGIIGTKNSVVVNSTKRVVFFLETNDPVKIRTASMELGIRTMAATLGEKWVDPELALTALKRGIKLFSKLTGATVASKIFDIYPSKEKLNTITAPLKLFQNRLGINISSNEVNKILKSLELNSNFSKKEKKFEITVPSFRNKDVQIPEDLVEEVARIYGYHKLPSQLMATSIPTNYPDQNFKLEHTIKETLSDLGLNELYTNSLISKDQALASKLPIENHLKIKNALSQDWQYLRLTLIPSHLEAIKINPHQKQVSFFEIANTYHPSKVSLPDERLTLTLTSTLNYPQLKNIVDQLFKKLHLNPEYTLDKTPPLLFIKNQVAKISLNNQPVGSIGQLHLPPNFPYQNITTAIFDLSKLIKFSSIYPQYQPVSNHPPIIEDLTFTLKDKTFLQPVLSSIKKSHSLIKKVLLTKTYQNNHTFNLTYQSPNKPLTAKSIAPVRQKIVSNLKTKYQAQLVGKL